MARAPRTATPAGEHLAIGALADIVGYHIAQAAVVTYASYETHLGKPFGLRKEEFSLLMLLLANGALPPKRLAQTLTLTAPHLTLMLDRLQARALLRREPHPHDGRSQNIVLTDAGRRLAREASACAVPMERALIDRRLTKAEHAMLIELLTKLAARPDAA